VSIPPEVVQALVIAAQVAPALFTGLMGALNPDAQEAVLAQVAASQRALPKPVSPEVEALIEKHKAIAAAKHPRISAHHADVIARLMRPTSAALLSHEERAALPEIEALLRDITAEPSSLAPPVLFAEPASPKD